MFYCSNGPCRRREKTKNGPKLSNSEILRNFENKLSHLATTEKVEMEQLLIEFKQVFGDVPTCTTCIHHNVNVGQTNSVKQHPYLYLIKLELMRIEIDYMLRHKIIESYAGS